ncbi:MAG: hypothetical protein ACLP9S_16620 [Syntrophales bacterium]
MAAVILSMAASVNVGFLNGSASDYSCLAGRVKGHGGKYIPGREVPFHGM